MKTKSSIVPAQNYSVYIGENVFTEITHFFQKPTSQSERKIFILVDENSLKHCLPKLIEEVFFLEKAEIIEIESGEENKNIEICTQIWRTLSELGADRKSLLINLGGGVISDMGGFIASTFKRGIDFINIPTTLLSQVDASVGGKTGIDLDHLKNEIGLFSSPRAVYIYPPFLKTVNKKQLFSGFAEMLKHALVADKTYWEELKNIDVNTISELEKNIFTSVKIKNEIVLKDPSETGIRKALNFGHTIGHALESYALESDGKPLLHGEAVAIGMICEAFISYKKKFLSAAELQEITETILTNFEVVKLNYFDTNRLMELMKHDKKNDTGIINFTLLNGIGNVSINQSCNAEMIIKSLHYYTEETNMLSAQSS
ncbi:MAG: 3-dehydroquinate synthase [Bacteroidia bacterium]